MPKIKEDLVGVSGKIGDKVFVHSHRYGPHVRSTARSISKKRLAALKKNYTRTSTLNKLAAGINSVITQEVPHHKPKDFYFQLQKQFRKQSSNNRYLLISSLKGMNIHPKYTLSTLKGDQEIAVSTSGKKIRFTLRVKRHPAEFPKTNCYSYELLLLSWNKSQKSPGCQRQVSDWIYLKKGKPEFEFSFSKSSNTLHWLLCLQQKMGLDGAEGSWKLQGMQILQTGSFNKKEESLLKKSQQKTLTSPGKQEKPIVRVKAKKFT